MRAIGLVTRASVLGILLMLGACGGSDEKTVIVQPQPQTATQPTVVVPPQPGTVKVCPSGQTIC